MVTNMVLSEVLSCYFDFALGALGAKKKAHTPETMRADGTVARIHVHGSMIGPCHDVPCQNARLQRTCGLRRALSHSILHITYNILSVGERIELLSHRNSVFRCYVTLGSTLLNMMRSLNN